MAGMHPPSSMRIGQLSQATGVSDRSLRYYEEQGLLHPRRNDSGQRLYRSADVDLVVRIQHLYAAGFCSRVIAALLPEILRPGRADPAVLEARFAVARRRLDAERRDIDRELEELEALRSQLGLAPDTHVRPQDRSHDPELPAPPAPPDHRGRRLR